MERLKVVAYTRVSTQGQGDNGCSLEAQAERCRRYADLYDLDVVEVIEDRGASGKSLDRPGLQRALSQLDAGAAEGLLVTKLDRATRSVRDLGLLLDRWFGEDFALFSVAEQIDTRTASGRLVLRILASVAEWEREAIGERTREALAHLKEQGAILGGEPYGWERTRQRDSEGRLLLRRSGDESAIVARILALNRTGESRSAIARRLNEEGVPSKRGGSWTHKTVGSVIRRAQAARPGSPGAPGAGSSCSGDQSLA